MVYGSREKCGCATHNPCLNNGTCIGEEEPECNCLEGYEGRYCSKKIGNQYLWVMFIFAELSCKFTNSYRKHFQNDTIEKIYYS